MCTNWKRFTLKAIMLASLSLFLYGCSGSDNSGPAQRTVNGVVSDNTGGQPFANATVTAYAIDAAGNVATTPLSAAPAQSDNFGSFALKIPASYSGGVVLLATGTGLTPIRSVVPDVLQSQVVVISPATDMAYQYVVVNKGGSFTSDNIQKAVLVLEPFFGLNFTQIPPPSIGSTPTPAQQQVLVVTQAINLLVNPATGTGTTIAALVKIDTATNIIVLGAGVGTDPNAPLTLALTATIADLISQNILPASYTLPTITPVSEPNLSDKIPPSSPPNLKATATSSSVTLTWEAATDNVGVTAYYVYRNGMFVSSILASAPLTYTDTTVNPATSYTYMVKARDLAGNVSAGNTVNITTLPILTFTISGKITSNGSGLRSAFVAISGSGTGIAVTDANGNYTFIGVRAGSYTITPTLAGFAFTPVSRPVIVATANITGMDFTAVPLIPGTVSGGVTNPDGSVTTTTTYPDGSVTTSTKYPNGTVTTTTTYPNGTVTITTTNPDGTVTTSITYPNGTVTTSTTYPNGTVTTSTTYPNGTVTTATTYPNGTVTTTTTNPNGTVTTTTTNPNGTVTAGVTNPAGAVNGGVVYPAGEITSNVIYGVIIFGRIMDSTDSVGLEGVPITITNNIDSTTITITTGLGGSYSFKGVPFITYTITPVSSSVYTFTTNATITPAGYGANQVPDILAD